MPSPKVLILLVLLTFMELFSGFTIVLGSGILAAIPIGTAMLGMAAPAALLGLGVVACVQQVRLGGRWRGVALLAGGLLAVCGLSYLAGPTLTSFLAAALILALAYWRGIAVTAEPPTHAEVQQRFGFGFSIMFLGIIWMIATGAMYQKSSWHILAILGIGYIVVSMIALGVSRLERVRDPGAGVAVFLAVTVQLCILLLAGFVSIELFALDIAGWLGHFLQPVGDVLATAANGAFELLFGPITWLINLFHSHAHPQPRPPIVPSQLGPHGNSKYRHIRPQHTLWPTLIGAIFLSLIFVGIATLIWRSLPRFETWRIDRGYREERRSLWSLSDIWRGLITWFGTIFRRGSHTARQATAGMRRRISGPSYPDDPIRRAYAQVLYRARVRGAVRVASATPNEFQLDLSRLWPEGSEDFHGLTEAYVVRRYGDVEPGVSDIDRTRETWQRLRLVMRRQVAPGVQRNEAVVQPASSIGPLLARPAQPDIHHRLWRQFKATPALQPLRDVAVEVIVSVTAVLLLFGFIVGLLIYLMLQH